MKERENIECYIDKCVLDRIKTDGGMGSCWSAILYSENLPEEDRVAVKLLVEIPDQEVMVKRDNAKRVLNKLYDIPDDYSIYDGLKDLGFEV